MRIANDTYHVHTYERTYASSTVSRHSGAETKKKIYIFLYFEIYGATGGPLVHY